LANAPAPYGVVPGYQYRVDELNRELERSIANTNVAGAKAVATIQTQAQKDIANINNTFAAQQATLDRALTEKLSLAENELALKLQSNQISFQKYQTDLGLKQQESEFARRIALDTLTADRNFKIQSAQQVQSERLLQAQLAANPQDLVAYEFYKRALGQPEAWDVAQQAAQGGKAPLTGPGAGGFGGTLSGIQYEAPPPAYSDATLQNLASGFFGGGAQQGQAGGQQALYNPALGGTGVFGAEIGGPQSISRAQAGQFSEQELGILSSFLRGGVETTPGGQRVSLDPGEYFAQTERSFIPTLGSVGTPTQYL